MKWTASIWNLGLKANHIRTENNFSPGGLAWNHPTVQIWNDLNCMTSIVNCKHNIKQAKVCILKILSNKKFFFIILSLNFCFKHPLILDHEH